MPTGRPKRTSLPLEFHRNAINRIHFGSSARHSTGPEEQSLTCGCQSGSVTDQLQCPGLKHRSRSNALSLSHFPSPPPPSFTQSPSPPRSLVRDGQTSPHRPQLVVSRSTCPPISPPPHANPQICTRSCSNKHTHTLCVFLCRGFISLLKSSLDSTPRRTLTRIRGSPP